MNNYINLTAEQFLNKVIGEGTVKELADIPSPLYGNLAKAIIGCIETFAEQKLNEEWIDVRDRLPKYGEYVNVCMGDVVGFGRYLNVLGWRIRFMFGEEQPKDFISVTHWMPLPVPPNPQNIIGFTGDGRPIYS